ncbi:endonuclease/exonuclease/phosphatase family protein [Streptomyces prasinus]|uniref:endonuclease/exonuclease/phosphatase family protein n=1 Tax=Streptomyces prasinus TaxID=67345 RepID=UPI0033BF0D9D
MAAVLLASTACGPGVADGSAKEASTDEPVAKAAQGARGVPSRFAVLTWNICGAIKDCPSDRKPKKKIDEIVKVVRSDPGYAVIMMQEACKSIHSDELADQLGDGWVVRHRTATKVGTREKVRCPASGNKDAGVAVAMKKLPGSKFVTGSDGKPGWNLTFPSTRGLEHAHGDSDQSMSNHATQGAACLQDKGNRLLACTSHFVHNDVAKYKEIQKASVKDLHRTTKDWQNGGYRTIVGGDFNIDVEGKRIKPLYAGNFEADSNDKCNTTGPRPRGPVGCRHVFGDKVDYVFFSDRGWKLRGGGVRYNGSTKKLSDHWMLTAAVRPS